MSHAGPTYHPTATGEAATTVADHQSHQDITLWAGWFCPFTQRAWIALEELGIPYHYKEINPYLKEKNFLAISPKGLVPALTVSSGAINDSINICLYLTDAYATPATFRPSLLPNTPFLRAIARHWLTHISSAVIPAFFRLLQAQPSEPEVQARAREELAAALGQLAQARRGKEWFFSEQEGGFGIVDIAIAPWAVREFVIRGHRGWKRDEIGGGWASWADRLLERESVKKTTSDRDKYVDFNRTFLRNEEHSQAGLAARKRQDIP